MSTQACSPPPERREMATARSEGDRDNDNDNDKHSTALCIRSIPVRLGPDSDQTSLVAATRRVFFEYISPMLPVLSHAILLDIFSDKQASSFVAVLRIALNAAVVPYLAPWEHALAGYRKREDMIGDLYEEAKDVMQRNMSLLTDLETVQVAVYLSFCARRHSGIPWPENQHWFQFALSRLRRIEQMAEKGEARDMPSRRQWRRIWWTCYLYERLDTFTSANEDPTPSFQLNYGAMSPLTLDDFELDTSLVSWMVENNFGSGIDIASRDMRNASIYVQKVKLARQIDEVLSTDHGGTLNPALVASSPLDDDHHRIGSQRFWDAYKIQLEFDSWQKQTGNSGSQFDKHNQGSPSLAVHWASLYLLYCRIVIGLYNSAFCVVKALTSQADMLQKALERDRIFHFYAIIVSRAKPLLDQRQVPYAHTTDPNIWASILTAAEALKGTRKRLPGSSHPKMPGPEQPSQSTNSSVTAFRAELAKWKSLPKPATAHNPELFRFPSPPGSLSPLGSSLPPGSLSPPGSSSSASDKSVPATPVSITQTDSASDHLAAFSSRKWDGLESSFMLEHIEAIVFNSGIC